MKNWRSWSIIEHDVIDIMEHFKSWSTDIKTISTNVGDQDTLPMDNLYEGRYFTGSMPLLTPNHSLQTCGDPEAFTTTTIFKNVV